MAQITLNSSGVASNGTLKLQSNGTTDAVTIDTAQNLGLGVTPSAWASNYKAFQIGSVGRSFAQTGSGAGDLTLAFNAIYSSANSRWDYAYTGDSAARYSQTGAGVHAWYNAASGTAGNAITFTQAMTLDASGNLGIGATSISANLQIQRAVPSFWMAETTSGTLQRVECSVSSVGVFNQNLNWNAGSASRAFTWSQGGTENMRIDSSGNLLVGTASQIASGFMCLSFANNVRNGIVINDTDTGSGTSAPMIFRRNGSQVGSITTTTTTTAYVTSSDYRLKENIVPMADALSVVAQLKPCTYTWKSDGSSGQGFIAHELQAVVPDAVVGEKDAVDEEDNPKYQGIDTSFLVATLTAALQEMKAIVDAQAVEIAALKGQA